MQEVSLSVNRVLEEAMGSGQSVGVLGNRQSNPGPHEKEAAGSRAAVPWKQRWRNNSERFFKSLILSKPWLPHCRFQLTLTPNSQFTTRRKSDDVYELGSPGSGTPHQLPLCHLAPILPGLT